MSTKTFTLMLSAVIAIGVIIGGGLVLAIGQNDDEAPADSLSQQQFGGGQFPSGGGRFGGAGSGGAQGGQFGGATAGGAAGGGDAQTGQVAPSRLDGGGIAGIGGAGGGLPGNILNGTVGAVDGNLITVTTDSGETQVILGDDSSVQTFEPGTVGDLSLGDRVLVIYLGDVESGEPVDAMSVVVNQPERRANFDRAGFGGGNFGGGGGFGGRGFLNGTVGAMDGNLLTVASDSGETLVRLGDDLVIQIYETAAAGDLSPGDRVLVIVSGDAESGEPFVAASVIVNPPEGGGAFGAGGFGAGGFGGRPPRP